MNFSVSNIMHKEVTFQSMFMYSDYILQHTQVQIFWRLVHGKVATLKVIVSLQWKWENRVSWCLRINSPPPVLRTHEQLLYSHVYVLVRMFMKTVPVLWGVWMMIIAYLLPVIIFCVSSLSFAFLTNWFNLRLQWNPLCCHYAKQVFSMQMYSSVKKGLSFPDFFLFFGKKKLF